MINKFYLGRYKSLWNTIKIGETTRRVKTRAKEISKTKKQTFSPLIFANFKDLNGAEKQYVESALRYYLSENKDIEFIEGSKDHLKILRKFENTELLELFNDFVDTLPKKILKKFISIEYYRKKSM